MSKATTNEKLRKIVHNNIQVENLELKDKIDLLTVMLSNQRKMNRKTYEASRFYDAKGYITSEAWEYQLVGTAKLTTIPISIIFAASAFAELSKSIEIPEYFILATGGVIALQTLTISATNAYMATKGASMANNIRESLQNNLEELGYEINIPSKELTLENDYNQIINDLIRVIELCKYDNYEEDINQLVSLRNKATNGLSLDLSKELKLLKASISLKIQKYRYAQNNTSLLNHQLISTKGNDYISLIEEDDFITEITKLIEEISATKYDGYEQDVSDLKEIGNGWLKKNIDEYNGEGHKLPPTAAPLQEFYNLVDQIKRKFHFSKNEIKTLQKKN